METPANVRRYNFRCDDRYLGSILLNDTSDEYQTVASLFMVENPGSMTPADWQKNTIHLTLNFSSRELDVHIIEMTLKKAGIDRDAFKEFHISRGMVVEEV